MVSQEIGGFLRFKYVADGKPSTPVFIRKEVYEYQSLKVREMFVQIFESSSSPSPEQLVTLMSTYFALGGLQLETPSETQKLWRIRFRVDVPVDCPAARFRMLSDVCSKTGDSMRKQYDFVVNDNFLERASGPKSRQGAR